ncbi:MAG: hypothetical protein WCJ17_00480 [bacterium]
MKIRLVLLLLCWGGVSLCHGSQVLPGVLTGGELNTANQMRGEYIKNTFNNIESLVGLQNKRISQVRDKNKKTFQQVARALVKLNQRLAKVQQSSSVGNV